MHSQALKSCLFPQQEKISPSPPSSPCKPECSEWRVCAHKSPPISGSHDGAPLRIAVLDSTPQTRGRAYRAIRRLGHVPVTLTNAAELRAYNCREGRFETSLAVLLVACPDDSAACRRLVGGVRDVLGFGLPLILSVSEGLLREITLLEAGANDTVVVAPSSVEAMYCALNSFLTRRCHPAVLQS